MRKQGSKTFTQVLLQEHLTCDLYKGRFDR
jgi:hypothetical protein